MSAPQIPNLSTLRRGGLRTRGRDNASSNIQDGGRSGPRESNKDAVIRATDHDASTSRLSAVEAGYLDDSFAKLLTGGTEEVTRRLPLMNRGTYVRTTAIDILVSKFLSSSTSFPAAHGNRRRKQIISLGAGSDTRYFRLLHQWSNHNILYHELDFPANTATKISHLRMPGFVSAAKSLCGIDLLSSDFAISENGTRLSSPSYCIHPLDLRSLSSSTRPHLPHIDSSLPTLLISECCLIYLTPSHADAVLSYFTSLFPTSAHAATARPTPLAIVIYEPIRPHDAFGRTMIANLTQRGIQLPTLEKYADLRLQKARLARFGFRAEGANSLDHGQSQSQIQNESRNNEGHVVRPQDEGSQPSQTDQARRSSSSTPLHVRTPEMTPNSANSGAEAVDINHIWKTWIPTPEKERVEHLEWMDEVEEFILLAQHYCVAYGWRGFDDDDDDSASKGWRELIEGQWDAT